MPESYEGHLATGNAHRAHARWEQARASYERALSTASKGRDADGIAESVLLVAHSFREAGRLEEAEHQYELSVTIAQLRGDDGRAARSANGLGITLQELGRTDDAEEAYMSAAALATRADDQLTLAHVHQNLGTLQNIRGRQRDALGFYTISLDYFRRMGDQRGVAGILNNMAMLRIDQRDFDAAERHLSAAFDSCIYVRDSHIESVLHLTSAELYLTTHRNDRARRHSEHALHLGRVLGQDRIEADALRLLGAVERADGFCGRAEQALLSSISICSTTSNPLTEAEAWHELALLFQQVGRDKEALEALDRAHRIFGDLDARHDLSDVKRRIAHTESTFLDMVSAWGESIDAIDEYTRGHCRRVAAYACMLGRAVGLAERDLFWVRIGALLHDVGKTAIPTSVLLKRGPLSKAERRVIEEHPLHGVRLLGSITLPDEVRAMIRSHHERWDGNGYPDRLCGEEIPFFARILTFADVFDALTTARSYRAALPVQEALSLMINETGQFDPQMIAEFLSLAAQFGVEATSIRSTDFRSFSALTNQSISAL